MWACKKCKEENEENFEICWNCQSERGGSRSVVNETNDSEIKEDVKKSRMKEQKTNSDESESYECSECGAEVTNDDKVCPKCGADVSEIEDEEQDEFKQSSQVKQNDFEKYVNILEFCPWTDAETAIKELQELGDTGAIPYIQPYLNAHEQNVYYAALVALENLRDNSILNHILSVISGRRDRLPILISFLNHSSFREHEKVITALVLLLSQKESLSLLIPFFSDTSLCKHKKVVPAMIDLLRDKELDLDEKASDLRFNILELLGKTENMQALVPLYAHTHSLSIDLSSRAIFSIMELNFDESITFLHLYLKNIKVLNKKSLLIGVKICEFQTASKRTCTTEIKDTIESFCKLFEQNVTQFQDIAQEIRGRLQKVVDKIGRKYPKSGLCFIATAACGTELEPEVIKLRRFRDEVLLRRWYGRIFVLLYERISPQIAWWIAQNAKRKLVTRRWIIEPLSRLIG